MGIRLARVCGSLLLAMALCPPATAVQVVLILTDAETNQPVAGANLVIRDTLAVQETDAQGRVSLALPAGEYDLTTHSLGYAPLQHHLVLRQDPVTVSLRLVPLAVEVSGTEVRASRQVPNAGHLSLPLAVVKQCPDPSPDPLRFVKVLPGVSSGNDQSNTYRVHGGAPAENLVCLNGVELIMPLQVRHGLAESFSLVNPDLLEQAEFHAGFVPVRYGDRLSSVLDASYRVPQGGLGGTVHLSTLQQSLAVQAGVGSRWRILSGVRRADLGRLTTGLQVSGQYQPRCWDWQTLLVWDPDPRTRVSLFGALLRSGYSLTPTSQTILFNCGFGGCDRFTGEGEGEESYGLRSSLLGLRASRQHANGEVVVSASVQHHEEEEDTDVTYLMRYQPSGDNTPSTTSPARSTEGYASRLAVWQGQAGVQLRQERDRHAWEAGLGLTTTDLEGRAEGLSQVTSTQGEYILTEVASETDRRLTDLYLYGQYRRQAGRVTMTPAVRLSRFGATGESALLPRMSLDYLMGRGWTLGVAGGRQAQPPQYGELAAATAGVRLQAQQADQASVWVDGRLNPALAWRTEAYYRRLRQVMPYVVDDARITYSGRSDATGRTWGLTTLFRGQLGPATGSISYSFLVAREDLAGDGLGELPGPGDQRHTLSVFLEDTMPPLRWQACLASRCHLRVLYGSGYPFTPKAPDPRPDQILGLVDGPRHSLRGGAYLRFDVGLTQTVSLGGHLWQLRQEIANLFDQYNVVSRTYLPAPNGLPVELRRSLGRRIYNLSVSTDFGTME